MVDVYDVRKFGNDDGFEDVAAYLNLETVRNTLYLHPRTPPWTPSSEEVGFLLERGEQGSVMALYPPLIAYPNAGTGVRVLIYNGDSDACVPYKGNEEWTEDLAAAGNITLVKAWHPWFAKTDKSKGTIPAGYATTYKSSTTDKDFSFVTIRLAGHMVPAFQPAAALEFFTRFTSGKPF